jgi:WD40-like Beta Propeller Repeat/Omp85 superfamily domain
VIVRRLIPAVTAFVLLLCSPSFAKFDPSFSWTTLESPHFLIHYHQGEEEIARRAAIIAEDVHNRLVPRIRWEPKEKTHIVLVDAQDEANGLTTPFPYDHMVLFITEPLGEPGLGTTAYDEWMRLLITHEYTHALQLDMVTGVPEIIKDIFGRIYFPNILEPIWMIEGLAVYEETEQTSGGRGRSPGDDMILRMASLEGPFPSLDQASVYPDSWPSGQVPYLFGESFTRYIVQKYGRDKLAEISIVYSGRGLPFLVDSTGERVLKRSYSDLWYEWEFSLKEQYRKQEQEVKSKGITISQPLTKKGYYTMHPSYSPDGKLIAYDVLNADTFPGIYVMNADGSGDRKLVDNAFSTTSSGESIAWTPDSSGIYYTKIDIQRNTDLYNDIYFYDLKRDKEVRITRGLRARDPYPSPDGRKLLFVMNKLGKTRLAMAPVPTVEGSLIEEKDIIYLSEESVNQYESPRFSPDGTMIVVSLWQPGGYKDIWILDDQGKKIEELMHDRAIDAGAAWSPDGKMIYFASDRTGIFNLYAYDLATKKISQITNVLGGAFTPAPSPDGKTIVFTNYSARGYDLNMLPTDPAAWKPAPPYEDRYPVISYNDRPVETKTSSYNPLPTLVPRFWLPWFGYSQESGLLGGFLTAGQDVVEHHSYLFTGLYGPRNDRKWYLFNYTYDGFYPTFNFRAQDTDVTYGNLLSDAISTADYVERSKLLDAALIFPLLKLEKQQALTIGYQRNRVSALTPLPPWTGYSGPVPAQGILASGRATYEFNNAKQYDFSISPENGRTIAVGYEKFDESLGSDFTYSKYTADWHEYINLPWPHQVLLVRGFAGTSSGGAIPQGAFSLGGDNPGDITIPIDQESVYLRGYPANEFRGRKAALASLEYRFPIKNLESGIGNDPVFFRRVHGAFFYESGKTWDNSFNIRDFNNSVGAEGRLDMYLAYYLPITLRVGIARGLNKEGETMIIFGLWAPAMF